MIGIFGIILSLVLLMYLAYRGWSVIILAPLLALLAAVFNGHIHLTAVYTQVFMKSMGDFAVKYFPIFLLGAVFGKLMEDSGCARKIALSIVHVFGKKYSPMAVVFSCALLTYGGISAFVAAFSLYPLAGALFKTADIPKRLIPGTIALGIFTFSMTALPGTVQIHNLIPMSYFKTDSFAAPELGLIAGLFMALGGLIWIFYRVKQANDRGEGYGTGHINEESFTEEKLPSFLMAVSPIILVIGLNYFFSRWIPLWDTTYITEKRYGIIDLHSVLGLWAVTMALFFSVVFLSLVHFKALKNIPESLGKGALGSLLPTFNTASEVGYGATVASLAGFALIKESVLNISPNPLLSEFVSVNVLAGITGSASGGLSIALSALGADFYQRALEMGISAELLHRIASLSSGGFDTLPHNGAVITLLTICGLSHRQSYKDIAVVSLLIPFCVVLSLLSFLIIFF